MITGIDVSQCQGAVVWSKVARWRGPDAQALAFAVSKASEGNTGVDPFFVANWHGSAAVGFVRGAYHYAHPDTVHVNDAEDEAQHFCKLVQSQGFAPGVDFVALDIEEARHVHPGAEFAQWCVTFLECCAALTGATPFLYSGGPFLRTETAGADPALVARAYQSPLWLAAYVTRPAVLSFVPRPWTRWTLWQESGDQAAADCSVLRVDGIAVNVDRDLFDGTVDELRTVIASLVPGQPVPDPTTPLDAPAHPLGAADRQEQEAADDAAR
ncbi:MAG: hypothetical protein NVS3B10_05770 [Polyangiales bacterium]